METSRSAGVLAKEAAELLTRLAACDLTSITDGVVCARSLRNMPVVEAAFRAGRLTPDHVRLLANARTTNDADFAQDEDHLVGLADELSYKHFTTALRYWRYLH